MPRRHRVPKKQSKSFSAPSPTSSTMWHLNTLLPPLPQLYSLKRALSNALWPRRCNNCAAAVIFWTKDWAAWRAESGRPGFWWIFIGFQPCSPFWCLSSVIESFLCQSSGPTAITLLPQATLGNRDMLSLIHLSSPMLLAKSHTEEWESWHVGSDQGCSVCNCHRYWPGHLCSLVKLSLKEFFTDPW